MDDAANLWTTDPRTALRVGGDFDLAAFDRDSAPGWSGGKDEAEDFMASRGKLLSELQERLFAHGRTGGDRSVLLIVQGLDTAGKGGIVRHVVGMVDPQGVALRAFGVPTAEEKRHHYLWRVRRALPRPGLIGVFDRSHYEDVLVVRVDGLVEDDVWSKRFSEINRFERQVAASGTTIVKIALMVSHEEQGLRLMERLDRPDKRWKYNPGDVDTRLSWDRYQAAYADVFARTSTDVAPWHVIPADKKWYARLATTELLTQALMDLDLGWPRPRWRLETQKRRLADTMSEESLRLAAANAEEKVADYHQDEAEFAEAVARADTDTAPAVSGTVAAEARGTADGRDRNDEAERGRTGEKQAKKVKDKKDKKSKKVKKSKDPASGRSKKSGKKRKGKNGR
jgi:PPK2 family polyphosphate:nucleotide phosphotransferase